MHDTDPALDSFFAGFAPSTTTSDQAGSSTVNSPPKATTDVSIEPAPSSAPWQFASYTVPNGSGVLMVKKYLEEHEFLGTQRIWALGTDGLKRPITPAFALQPDGRVRMKRVATMREGRRAWIPPAESPFPDHPFRSVA